MAALRAMSGHGGELTIRQIVAWTGLSVSTARDTIVSLEETSIIERLGGQRGRIYRLRDDHPLRPSLDQLFRHEADVFAKIRSEVVDICHATLDVQAAWLYGSVARQEDRPGSDIDLAIITRIGARSEVGELFRERLIDVERLNGMVISVIAIDLSDVLSHDMSSDPWWRGLVSDAVVLHGQRPSQVRAAARDLAPQLTEA